MVPFPDFFQEILKHFSDSLRVRERETVPDGRTNQRRARCPSNFVRLLGIRKMILSVECVMGCAVQGGQIGKEEQCKWSFSSLLSKSCCILFNALLATNANPQEEGNILKNYSRQPHEKLDISDNGFRILFYLFF